MFETLRECPSSLSSGVSMFDLRPPSGIYERQRGVQPATRTVRNVHRNAGNNAQRAALRHRFVVGSDDKSVELRKNALSLIPGNFALLTFVLEDNVGIDSFERGIRLRFYLNDELYHTETAAGSLRQNDAPLHLLLDQDPEQRHGIDHCKIADLTYYNFALADAEVAAMFSRGYTNAENKDFDTVYSKDNRLKLSAYNKVDLYNYDAHLS